MMRAAHRWPGVAAVLVCAATVQANAGSGMAMLVAGHLLFGNFFIGVIEGLLAYGFFGCRSLLAIPVMIVANYVSAWVGMFTVVPIHGWVLDALAPYPIDALFPALAITAALSLGASIVLEFPAFALIARRSKATMRRALVGAMVINIPTNAAVWVYYGLGCDLSLATSTTRAKPATVLAGVPGFDMYTLSQDGAAIEHCAWDGVGWAHLDATALPVGTDMTDDELVPYPFPQTPGASRERIDALISRRSAYHDEFDPMRSVQGIGPTLRWLRPKGGGDDPNDDYALFMLAALWWDYRADGDDAWRPYSIGTGMDWCAVRDRENHWIVRLACMSPGSVWTFERMLALPGDVLVVEVADQVLAIHVPTMRMAPLARGTSPVILMRAEPQPPITPASAPE